MPNYAFTSPMSLTCPEEQTKYACLFSWQNVQSCFQEFACLIPWLGQEKVFFTIEIGHEIFSRAIFSLPLVFSYWLKQKIKTISYSSSSLLKKLASLYEPHHEKTYFFIM